MRRLLLGLGSQGLSSISNFALVVVVAQSSSAADFGRFAIAYSVSLLVLGSIRGAVGETLAVTRGSNDDRAALGAAVLLAIWLAAMVASFAILWVGGMRSWLLVVAAGLPFLALQDAGRFVGFARLRPGLATTSDGVWLGVQLAGWLVLIVAGGASGMGFFTVWWGAAGVAAVVLSPKTGWPDLPGGWMWLRRNGRLAGILGVESLASLGGSQAAVYAVGFVAGLPAAGALRGVQSLYGPVRAISGGVNSVALPEATRRRRDGGYESLVKYAVSVAAWLTALGVVSVVILSLIPDGWGRALLDETWPLARKVIPAVGVGLVAGMAMNGVRIGLRSARMGAEIVRLRVVATILVFALGIGGAVAGGLLWSAWGLALAQVATVLLGWRMLLGADMDRSSGVVSSPSVARDDAADVVDEFG